jgi:hypothetical protein
MRIIEAASRRIVETPGCDGVHCDKRIIGSWRQTLSMSREAVPNLNQRIRVGADGDQGISAVRMTPQWTTGMRRVGVWRGGFRWSMSVCRPFRLAVP